MLGNLKAKLDSYLAKKKEDKQFKEEIFKEAREESKEEIKEAVKEKIKDDYVKKFTTTKGEKVKQMFNMEALGDVNAKINRMTGNKTNATHGIERMTSRPMNIKEGVFKMTDSTARFNHKKKVQDGLIGLSAKDKLEMMMKK